MGDRELQSGSLRWKRSGQAVALVVVSLGVAWLIARLRGEATWAEMFFLLLLACWAVERAVLNVWGPQRVLARQTPTGVMVLFFAVLGLASGLIAFSMLIAMLIGLIAAPSAFLGLLIVCSSFLNILVSLGLIAEGSSARKQRATGRDR